MSELKVCRGYISSRSFAGNWVPQHIQNTIIRDYCNKKGFHYLLSAAEYAIPNCYMVLEEMTQESGSLFGIVLYSIYQLPSSESHRIRLCESILASGCFIYSSVEDIFIGNEEDLYNVNIILNLNEILSACISNFEF